MRIRLIIAGGLLVLLPALVIGAVSLRLLRHEEERLARRTLEAGEGRLRTLAAEIEAVVRAAHREIDARLAVLDPGTAAAALEAWQAGDPLVRQVFLARRDGAVLLPDAARGMSSAERDFLRRIEPLLSGRVPWAPPPTETAGETAARRGWIPWFDGEALNWIGWIALGDDLIAGVEIETMTLLARVLAVLPPRG